MAARVRHWVDYAGNAWHVRVVDGRVEFDQAGTGTEVLVSDEPAELGDAREMTLLQIRRHYAAAVLFRERQDDPLREH